MRICAFFFFFQAEDGIRDLTVTGVQTCALPICKVAAEPPSPAVTYQSTHAMEGRRSPPWTVASARRAPRGADHPRVLVPGWRVTATASLTISVHLQIGRAHV